MPLGNKGISRRGLIGAGAVVAASSLPGNAVTAGGQARGAAHRGSGILRRDFRVDVARSVGPGVADGKPQWLGARLIAPRSLDLRNAVPVVACIHGGTFDRHYFDLQVPGRQGYSMGEYFAARGVVVIAFDMLGIGGSSRPSGPEPVSRFVQAAALDAAVREVYRMLATGRLDRGLPAIPRIRRIGLAHSMGVMVGVVQQARHRTFEQILLLGYSVRGVALRRSTLPPSAADVAVQQTPQYISNIRRILRTEYYLDDVPPDVIAADEAVAAAAPMPAGKEAQQQGVALAEAGEVTVPVFLGFGEHDISPDPRSEVGAFARCNDLSLGIFSDVAHAHNAANGRRRLWDACLAWIAARRDLT